MSYDVNVFLRGVDFEQVLGVLGSRMDVHPTASDAETSTAKANVSGLRLAIVDGHDLDDDAGIEFSGYPVQISFTLYAGRLDPESGRDLCRAMARAVARTVHEVAGGDYLLVAGLQQLLERSD